MYHNNSLKAIINSSDSSRNFGMFVINNASRDFGMGAEIFV